MSFWIVTSLYALSLYFILKHNEKLKREIQSLNENVLFSEEEYKNLMKRFNTVKEGKQSIINDLRKDLNQTKKYYEYARHSNGNLVRSFTEFRNSVFYHPKLNEIIIIDDLTKIGKL